jgi:hypothetical protein
MPYRSAYISFKLTMGRLALGKFEGAPNMMAE